MTQLDITIKSRIFRLEASGWQHGLGETDWWVAPQRRRGVLLAANRERWENKKNIGNSVKKKKQLFSTNVPIGQGVNGNVIFRLSSSQLGIEAVRRCQSNAHGQNF